MRQTQIKICIAIFWGCVQSISALGCAWLLSSVVNAVTENPNNFHFFCIAAIIYYGAYILFYYLSGRYHLDLLKHVRLFIKDKLFVGLLWTSDLERGKKTTIGEILSIFQQQVDVIEQSYIDPLMNLIKNIVTIVVASAAMLFVQWELSIGIAGCIFFYLFVTKGINKKLEELQTVNSSAVGKENEHTVVLVQGFFSAKDWGQEDFFLSRYADSASKAAEASFRYTFTYDLLYLVSTNIEAIIALMVILVGGLMLSQNNPNVSAGSILGLTQLLSSTIGPIGNLGPMIIQIRSTRGIRQKLKSFQRNGEEEKRNWERPSECLPKIEELSFRNVTFSYDGCTILENISLSLYAGKKYAIVGESGSGKTTFLKLLLALIKPEDGEIYWNDVPYSTVSNGSLIKRFAYVAQEPMIFQKTVRANIVGGSNDTDLDCNDEKLIEVLKRSNTNFLRHNISITDLLALPAKELSGGEKKRVAYARALYKECDVIVLDEITSSVDTAMAQRLEKDLLQTTEKTVVHVTHQLTPESFYLYDEVLYVSNKKIKKIDTADEIFGDRMDHTQI